MLYIFSVRIKGVPVRGAYFSNGTGNPDVVMLLENIECKAIRVALGQPIDYCNKSPWGVVAHCTQQDAAGVICLDTGRYEFFISMCAFLTS